MNIDKERIAAIEIDNRCLLDQLKELEEQNRIMREALEKISKAEGITDMVVCLALISGCANIARQALEVRYT